MQDNVDELQIKIDKARLNLPEDTKRAISAVDWKNVILGMRQSKGYSFEQLGDLETETELLLCGLVTPEEYTKELERRMQISRSEANQLVNELNKLIFSKIREEMIKISENKKKSAGNTGNPMSPNVPTSSTSSKINSEEKKVLDNAGIQILNHPDLSTPEIGAPSKPTSSLSTPTGSTTPILAQKLGGSFQTPATKTEHTLEKISKPAPTNYPPKADPYRLSPDE